MAYRWVKTSKRRGTGPPCEEEWCGSRAKIFGVVVASWQSDSLLFTSFTSNGDTTHQDKSTGRGDDPRHVAGFAVLVPAADER